MKYIVMLLLLSTCFANATGTIIKWHDGERVGYWTRPDNKYYGVGMIRRGTPPTPGYPSGPFSIYAIEVNLDGSNSKVKFCLNPNRNPRLFNVYGEYDVVNGMHQYKLSSPLYVTEDLIAVGFTSSNPNLKIGIDAARCVVHWYYNEGTKTWPAIPTQPRGDFLIGLVISNNTGINPTSLGRVKALYR